MSSFLVLFMSRGKGFLSKCYICIAFRQTERSSTLTSSKQIPFNSFGVLAP